MVAKRLCSTGRSLSRDSQQCNLGDDRFELVVSDIRRSVGVPHNHRAEGLVQKNHQNTRQAKKSMAYQYISLVESHSTADTDSIDVCSKSRVEIADEDLWNSERLPFCGPRRKKNTHLSIQRPSLSVSIAKCNGRLGRRSVAREWLEWSKPSVRARSTFVGVGILNLTSEDHLGVHRQRKVLRLKGEASASLLEAKHGRKEDAHCSKKVDKLVRMPKGSLKA